MRGTFKGIEIKCRGGVQAHSGVGSLKLLQDLHYRHRALYPASAPVCLLPSLLILPLMNSLRMACGFYGAERSQFVGCEKAAS